MLFLPLSSLPNFNVMRYHLVFEEGHNKFVCVRTKLQYTPGMQVHHHITSIAIKSPRLLRNIHKIHSKNIPSYLSVAANMHCVEKLKYEIQYLSFRFWRYIKKNIL